MGMIGKLGIAMSFDAIYTWSVELHPTVIRYVFMVPLRSSKLITKFTSINSY